MPKSVGGGGPSDTGDLCLQKLQGPGNQIEDRFENELQALRKKDKPSLGTVFVNTPAHVLGQPAT